MKWISSVITDQFVDEVTAEVECLEFDKTRQRSR